MITSDTTSPHKPNFHSLTRGFSFVFRLESSKCDCSFCLANKWCLNILSRRNAFCFYTNDARMLLTYPVFGSDVTDRYKYGIEQRRTAGLFETGETTRRVGSEQLRWLMWENETTTYFNTCMDLLCFDKLLLILTTVIFIPQKSYHLMSVGDVIIYFLTFYL